MAATTDASPGTYNAVDNEPVTREVYDTVVAGAIGRKRLRPVPAFAVRLMGDKVDHVMRSQRVSNQALRRSTTWQPAWPSVRDGIPQW